LRIATRRAWIAGLAALAVLVGCGRESGTAEMRGAGAEGEGGEAPAAGGTDSAERAGSSAAAAKLRQALLDVAPGDTVTIPEGRLEFRRGLSLRVDGVTVKGAGSGASVLSFAGQRQGAEGLLVTADDVTLQGFAIEDAAGDALKVNEARAVVIRDVRAEWTEGPSPDNGAYGIYPVQCEDVLIEDSVAIGASDAGIYVGQSQRVIVRRNRAERNVAGIEIENTVGAEVYANEATRNTAGILVFDLPDLPVQGGRETRVYANRVVDNNTPNFAPEGNIVASVPAGTGVLVNATDRIEIFDNAIRDHATAAVMLMSYLMTGRPIEDPDYDPYPEGVEIHHNRLGRAGYRPDEGALEALRSRRGRSLPPILWDGFLRDGAAPEDVVCAHDNENGGFAMLDAPNNFSAPRYEAGPNACEMPPVPGVTFAHRRGG